MGQLYRCLVICTFSIFFSNFLNAQCPNVIDPVCSTAGITYLNSCYAQVAGESDYVVGICFSECIEVDDIDLSANCPTNYDPVCGCNNITYNNACEAEKSGVTNYTTGQCSQQECYVPQKIFNDASISINETTGVVTPNCDDAPARSVCGCDGITYTSPCLAQASGIYTYTRGTCESDCIDIETVFNSDTCGTNFDPVCGCNDETYFNACYADAAGVQTYTSGPCSAASSGNTWCLNATPLFCGNYLPYETTIGENNSLSSYPGCTSSFMAGPDKVYVINKTVTGDLQIGLEILTQNLDLDIFLLAGDCYAVTCLASSTTSNTYSNNEGILYPDAPNGIYYLVVDAQYANASGNYRLEMSCGDLDCTNAIPLVCNTPYQGTNINGTNSVSLYTCNNNNTNVENNGKEKVHQFTITQAGNVTISLTGLTQNLEMFLLNSCSASSCIGSSSNSGNTAETITKYLTPGTYFVVVDGYNSAVSNYTLNVNCTTGCNLWVTANAIDAGCGVTNGKIQLNITGGNPGYIIHWTGPVSGSTYTYSSNPQLNGLPAGLYWITITDAFGCSKMVEVELSNSGAGLNFTANANNSSCGASGTIAINVLNGTAPFTVYLGGPVSGTFYSNSYNFTLNNLLPGTYSICIVDATGCSKTKVVTLSGGGYGLNAVMTPTAAACESPGKIHVSVSNGTAPYWIQLSGPVNGTASTYSSSFNIVNLPGGTYVVTITDGSGCSTTQTVVVPSQNLWVTASSSQSSCAGNGGIVLNINSGAAPYTISWAGAANGTITTNNSNYTIPNLPSGTYQVTIMDANWCTVYKWVTVYSSGGGSLNAWITPTGGGCNGQSGAASIDISGGLAPYQISWTGPTSGSTVSNSNWLSVDGLTPGTYYFTISDANGCTVHKTVFIPNTGNGNIELWTTVYDGSCNSNGSISLMINNAAGPYTINYSGPVSGTINSNLNNVDIPNLPAGTYQISVTDGNGCYAQKLVTIDATGGNSPITASATTMDVSCGMLGSLWLVIDGGTAPYTVTWSGPVSGVITSDQQTIDIFDLPAGYYNVTIVDANGCDKLILVLVQNSGNNLQAGLSSAPATCDSPGSILVTIQNGSSPYTISWSGAATGSETSNNQIHLIDALPAGSYSVVITDSNGCSVTKSKTVGTNGSTVSFAVGVGHETCDNLGSFTIAVQVGTSPFTIDYSGPMSGSVNSNMQTTTINGLSAGIYTLSVTDANGCSKTVTKEILSETNQVTAAFTFTVNQFMVSFQNQSQGGVTYAWDFGDGNTSTSSNPSHTYMTFGDYQVCLTAQSDCGIDVLCKNITIDAGAGTVILDVGIGTGLPEETVSIPVTVFELDTLLSITASLQISDASIGTLISVSSGMISPVYNPSLESISFFAPQGNGVGLVNGDTLFFINVLLAADAQGQATISLDNTPIVTQVVRIQNGVPMFVPHTVLDGSVVVGQTGGFVSGNILSFVGHEMQNVNVNLTGGNFNGSTSTDANGNYAFNGVPQNVPMTLTFEKQAIDVSTICAYELFVGQQYLKNLSPDLFNNPLQMIASDADCNELITSNDLSIIQQVLLRNQSGFDPCNNWAFVSADFQPATMDDAFSYEQHIEFTHTGQALNFNVIGIQKGDFLPESSAAPVGNLKLGGEVPTLTAGETIVIPVYAEEDVQLVSMQFGFKYNTDILSKVKFIPNTTGRFSSAKVGAAYSDMTFLSWFDVKGEQVNVQAGDKLFSIEIKAAQDVDDISTVLLLADHMMRREAHKINGDKLMPLFSFASLSTSTNNEDNLLGKVRIYPNPFTEGIWIEGLNSGGSITETKVTVMDINGKIIVQQQTVSDDQTYISLENASAGTFIVQLKQAEKIRSMKIIKM